MEIVTLLLKHKDMGKIIVNVDWCGSNYAAAPANEDIACVATGKSFTELRDNMRDALDAHMAGMVADSEPLPAELQGHIEIKYHMTTRAQLHYSENFITRKALSKETGINLQQLSHYANGWRHPRPEMQQRILSGIQKIGKELTTIS